MRVGRLVVLARAEEQEEQVDVVRSYELERLLAQEQGSGVVWEIEQLLGEVELQEVQVCERG